MTVQTNRAPSAADAGLPDGDGSLGLIEIGIILKSMWKSLVLVPVVVAVLAYGVAWLIPPTFTAQTTFIPPQQQQSAAASALSSLGALANLTGAGSAIKSPADQYLALMQSVTVTDRLIDQFKLIEVYEAKYRIDARRELAQNVVLSLGKKDGLISVSVSDKDPKRAADMANAYVDELRRMTATLAVSEAQQRRVFFEKQLLDTKDKLAVAQTALQASGFTEGALRSEPKAAAETYARLQAEVTAAEVRVQTMRGYLSDTAPEFRRAQDTLAALRAQLSRTEQAAKPAPGNNDYVGKYREFKYQETLFELFSRQYELAKVDESREGTLIQVVDPAAPPEKRSKPVRTLIALSAALVAALAMIGLVLGRYFLRTASRDPEQARRLAALRESLGRP